MSKRVSKRAEEYLEVIYSLASSGEELGVRKLAKIMGVKPSSVLEYLRRLCSEGYIVYSSGGRIELTEKGLKLARELRRRHEIIKEFLVSIGVPEDIADRDACYIEHGVHPETLEKIVEFLRKHRGKC